MIPYIFNIQRFSLHDGPGIRTTVFFKGCPLRCLWCHNPESQNFRPEIMLQKEDLVEEKGNKRKEILIGTQYTIRELVKIIKKDQIFYDQSGGGVTLSGGEVMAQNMDYVKELVKALHREGISVVIDTSGYGKRADFEELLPYTDLFLYDLKMIEDDKHRIYTGCSNEQILANLKLLSDKGAEIELRMIMVKGVNMTEEQIETAMKWLAKEQIRLTGITLLPYHDFGRDKYRKLERECTQIFEKPEKEELERVKMICESYGFQVKIHE